MAIEFKHPELQYEFDHRLTPGAQGVAFATNYFLERAGLHPLVITRIVAPQAEVDSIYGTKGRFSWHLPDAMGFSHAFDARNKCYDEAENQRIYHFLKGNWPGLEILMHNVGRGNHFHVADPGAWSKIRRLRRVAARRAARRKGLLD